MFYSRKIDELQLAKRKFYGLSVNFPSKVQLLRISKSVASHRSFSAYWNTRCINFIEGTVAGLPFKCKWYNTYSSNLYQGLFKRRYQNLGHCFRIFEPIKSLKKVVLYHRKWWRSDDDWWWKSGERSGSSISSDLQWNYLPPPPPLLRAAPLQEVLREWNKWWSWWHTL